MKDSEIIKIKKPEGYNCFACGTANPIGLNLEFYTDNEKVFSEITLGKYHVGWADITHGGIISTLLDEVMSWTILYFKRIFFVTRKMEIKYIKPVQTGVPLVVSGSIITNEMNEKVVSVFVESLLPAKILNGNSQQIKSASKKLLIEDVMFIGYQHRVIRNDSVIFSFFQK